MSLSATTILTLISTGTQFLGVVSNLLPRLRALLDDDALTPAEKAALDAQLDAWAESNLQLSATIQSFRTPR